MQPSPLNAAVSGSVVLVALLCTPLVRAGEDSPHRLGDHPAIVVQRLAKTAGYDYASKFYPHPAWMYLQATQPHVDESLARASNAQPDAGESALQVAQKTDALRQR